MENLDDLMRKKFNTAEEAGRYEFQEQYWDQARALIEADERKRKRRRILLWWWFGGIFVLSMAGIYGVINYKNVEHATTKTTRTENYTEQSGPNSKESNKEQETSPSNTQATEYQLNNKNKLDSKAISLNDAPTINSSGRSPKSGGATPLSANLPKLKSPTQQSDKTPQHAENESSLANVNIDQNKDHQDMTPENKRIQEATKDKPAPGSNTETTTEAGRDNTEASPKEDASANGLNKMVATAPALPSPAPPLGYWLLEATTPTPTTPQVPVPPVKIHKKRSHNISVFVSTAQSLTKGEKQGFALGLTYEGHLKHGLFYTGQLGWRYLPYAIGRDSLTPPASQQLRYSFGYQQNRSWFTAMNQHLLELPVGLGWRFKGLYVHAGLHAALRLATQATILEENKTTLSPAPVVKTSKIGLENAPLPQFWARPYTALGYGVGRFDVRVKAVWLPDFEARATDGQRNGTQRPLLDFGLGYRF